MNKTQAGKKLIQAYVANLDKRKKGNNTDYLLALQDAIDRSLEAAEDQGFDMACQMIEVKLLDSPEANRIRAEATIRARQLRMISKYKVKKGIK